MNAELKRQIRALSEPNGSKFYIAFAVELSCLTGILIASTFAPWQMFPLFVFLLGVFQHRFALLGHDACHVNFTKYRWVNRLTTEFIGYPIFVQMFGGYREYHFRHHSKLGTKHDPELNYRAGWGNTISQKKVILTFLTDLLGFGARSEIRFIADCAPKDWISRVRLVVCWVAMICAAFYLQLITPLAVWVVALFSSFWAVFRVRAFLEHVGVEDCGQHTSHRFDTNPILRAVFFPHNTWCHYEHHLFPTVPFYNLPLLRQLLRTSQYKPITTIPEILVDA